MDTIPWLLCCCCVVVACHLFVGEFMAEKTGYIFKWEGGEQILNSHKKVGVQKSGTCEAEYKYGSPGEVFHLEIPLGWFRPHLCP